MEEFDVPVSLVDMMDNLGMDYGGGAPTSGQTTMKGAPSLVWTLGSVVAISHSRVDSPGGRGATKVTEVIGRDTLRGRRFVSLIGGVCGCVFFFPAR